MGILERIADIEAEMARTQKNKKTEYHLGRLKAQLAKLRTELIEAGNSSSHKGEGFDVIKQGDARVVLIGFPSVGKSTLLCETTGAESAIAAYEFTTLTCVPGVMKYNNAKIQLLDLPGIIEGAASGRGRGRQVIAVAQSADLILMVLDCTKDESQKRKLEIELESIGIRLNKRPPMISIRPKKIGGITFNSTVPLTHLNNKMIINILNEYKIYNADILIKEDCTIDDFIDCIEGNRKYIPCLYVYNKIDNLNIQEIDELARRSNSVVISSQKRWNLDTMIELIWDKLGLVRLYTKKKGELPDFSDPLILTPQRGNIDVETVVRLIHKDLISEFKHALVWGTSVKHNPQCVGLTHKLNDEDVIQLVKSR
ncbi:developmentally regulated GTP-binding protein 2, putative [Cryptosporidium muris RN66]|uniref:Developmentally regulated GTP-binding protein 2, putative n=1 Tax=Cryptosporidium muris (strain RN66) TaxID=441375 RepID=B6A9A7_CRYMR|nr:developmentally regulated GTP-binding protein 2, putative [Cryptosporidium muris RN66]EEA04798.1 developmentally regulated GTP-binding protein 2, putative [Cryptosporidium muris RN66]|eukprot:XP_002139147.1 developmentally regulated GTP-binding protein 2 [Cryptosporidium muris RN66]